MGASAFLKSVDFRAFAVNVKTIAPKKYLYQCPGCFIVRGNRMSNKGVLVNMEIQKELWYDFDIESIQQIGI